MDTVVLNALTQMKLCQLDSDFVVANFAKMNKGSKSVNPAQKCVRHKKAL